MTERVDLTPLAQQATLDTFEAWREMERVEVCAEVMPSGVGAHRNYGRENPNIRADIPEPVRGSRRAQRALHLREISEHVGGSVRVGSVNRFKIR